MLRIVAWLVGFAKGDGGRYRLPKATHQGQSAPFSPTPSGQELVPAEKRLHRAPAKANALHQPPEGDRF